MRLTTTKATLQEISITLETTNELLKLVAITLESVAEQLRQQHSTHNIERQERK